MSLITETGSGSSTAESLCDVATADAYFSSLGNTTWSALTTAQKEQALRKSTNYMEQIYKGRWQGVRFSSTQALDWPRYNVIANDYVIASNIVPVPVQRACAELAVKASAADLLSDVGQQKLRTKVGEIEVEYDKTSRRQTQYAAVDAMLAPYFNSSAIVHRLER